MIQAGVVPVTWQQVLLEWQRDWARKETYDAVMAIVREHSGGYGMGVDYAYTMVHKAPQRTSRPPRVVRAGAGVIGVTRNGRYARFLSFCRSEPACWSASQLVTNLTAPSDRHCRRDSGRAILRGGPRQRR